MHHGARILGLRRCGVLVHQTGEQLLIETAPIDTDADRLVMLQRLLDDGRELPVALGLESDVAGIDAILVERLRAGRVFAEQRVAVVMEVAHQRHVDAHPRQPVADMRHGLCRLVAVHRDAHDLGAGACQVGTLLRGRGDVRGIGVGHRLHDDGGIPADEDPTDVDRHGTSALGKGAGHRLASRWLLSWRKWRNSSPTSVFSLIAQARGWLAA
jgi:hypothetical protein